MDLELNVGYCDTNILVFVMNISYLTVKVAYILNDIKMTFMTRVRFIAYHIFSIC